MKKRLTNLLLILMLIVGVSLLLYPSVSDYWNSLHATRAIASYVDAVAEMDNSQYDTYREEARAYNASLLHKDNPYYMGEEEKALYDSLLDPRGDGLMGFVEIPRIKCSIPLYHGTEESVLQIALGHLDWTSLPVGGESSHCAVSGHRGLPSARLFTDLDQLVVGDEFYLHILDETLTYQVDQILVVEPHETEALLIEEGMDLCTLVTCTPYGINSHRMLVRGHRIEGAARPLTVRVTADALQVEPLLVACVVFVPVLLLFFLLSFIDDRIRKKRGF